MRPDTGEDFAAEVVQLEEAAGPAEKSVPQAGLWHSLRARIKGVELPRDLPLEVLLAAKPDQVAGKLVRVEGLLRPQDSGAIVPLLAGDEPARQLRLAAPGSGALPRLKTDKGRVLDTPLVVTGRVNVLPASPSGHPQYNLVGAQPPELAPAPLRFRIAFLYEAHGKWEKAVDAYTSAFEKRYRTHQLAPQALYQAAQIADRHWEDKREGAKRAGKLYSALWTSYVQAAARLAVPVAVLVPQDGQVRQVAVKLAIGKRMDELNSANILYKIMQSFAVICRSGAWGVLLLALVTRVLMFPLSKKQVVAQVAMQKLQPEVKRIQEKYKDDKATQQKKMMELYRQQGVSMFGGCLPLLIQMPILIALYMGIRMYIYQFSLQSFLWVRDLSAPDLPLLVAYTISMVVFQKITAKSTPATDPQQQQMQKTMAWMMPIMFFFIFQTFPAAFILYWLGTNIIYAGQQYWLTRGLEAPQPGEVVTMKPNSQTRSPGPARQQGEARAVTQGQERQPARERAPASSPKPAPEPKPEVDAQEREVQKRQEREQDRKLKKEARLQQRLKKQEKRRRGKG